MNKKYRLSTLTLPIAALMIFSNSAFAQENVRVRESPSKASTGKLTPCPAPGSSTDHAINTKGAGGVDRIVPGGQSSPMNPNAPGGSTTPQETEKKGKRSEAQVNIGDVVIRRIRGGCDETVAAAAGDLLEFTWPQVAATPTGPVTYRLKVWQLMQGQNGTTAMRTNKPVVEKDVIGIVFTVESSMLGPCKPPYMCDFIWEVQAFSAGKPVGKPQISTYDLKVVAK